MVDKFEDRPGFLDQETVVIADTTGFGGFMDALRESGYIVATGCTMADTLECDRKFAIRRMKEAGLQVPKSKHFDDWDDAREFVSNHEGRLVFKPEGELSGDVPSYVSYDSEDLLEVLDHYSRLAAGKANFLLQEFIENATELSLEGWFDGNKFLRPFSYNLERKQLMNDDLGPSGGCVGVVVWRCEDNFPEKTLLKMERILTERRYIGSIDINTMVTDDAIVALEFTPRFGYDTTPTMFYEVFNSELGKFFSDFARGQMDEVPMNDLYGGGIRVTVSPWPFEQVPKLVPVGLPVRGLRKSDMKHFYPYDVELSDGLLVTSGGYGSVCVLTSSNSKLSDCFEDAYAMAERLRLPGKQYRTDLSEQFESDMRRLNRKAVLA